MKALVVYESMFGNTKTVAEAIADGMGPHVSTGIWEVGEIAPSIPDDVDLLVVGGPTHAFGMSRTGTRQQAAAEAGHPLVSRGPGLREWLDQLQARPGLAVATFDTSFKKIRRLGTAGKSLKKRLTHLGLHPLADPESFFVEGTSGPLAEGERVRAFEWGDKLALTYIAKSEEEDVLGGLAR